MKSNRRMQHPSMVLSSGCLALMVALAGCGGGKGGADTASTEHTLPANNGEVGLAQGMETAAQAAGSAAAPAATTPANPAPSPSPSPSPSSSSSSSPQASTSAGTSSPAPASVPPPPPPLTTPPVQVMSPGYGVAPFPVGSPGQSGERIQATSEAPTGPSDTGSFRLRCDASHFANDDPIVYPGQVGRSHLHIFFGNTGTSAHSTTESLTTTGNSTCNGGTVNRTAYWAPAVIDMRTSRPILPTTSDFYYKTGYNGVRPADVKPFPRGLRMIAGDPANRTANEYGSPYRFMCHNDSNIRGQTFVACAVGDDMDMEIFFPQCWDGVNLDSPDHKSHMAYPRGNGCPASHPVAVPEMSIHLHYHISEPNQQANWRLSSDTYSGPAGYSAHADWWNGWNQTHMETWVRECNNPGLDCHSHLLGAYRALY